MSARPNVLRGLWRLFQPIRNWRGTRFLRLPWAYARYFAARRRFCALGGVAPFEESYPIFYDEDPTTQSGGGQYFYQDIWALRRLAELAPAEHHDVGSRLDGFVGQATAICDVSFWDIRPPAIELPRLTFRQGSILELPLPDHSLKSLSCLHTIEHIGLGRYGDPLDPAGTEKAVRELGRVLAVGGQLLISSPIGAARVCFNALRVLAPEYLPEMLPDLTLEEFAAIDDEGRFRIGVSPRDFANAKEACGLYRFVRPSSG